MYDQFFIEEALVLPSFVSEKNFYWEKQLNNNVFFVQICLNCISPAIRIGREIQCLPCAGSFDFFLKLLLPLPIPFIGNIQTEKEDILIKNK